MSEAPRPERKLTLGDLDRFLGAPPKNRSLASYRAAAAVLVAFDPFDLRPSGAASNAKARDHALDALLALSEPAAYATQSGLWTLALPERRDALQKMGTREKMKEALAANPERLDAPLQRMFERVLETEPIPLAELSRDELAALLSANEWLDGILDGLPDPVAVRRALTQSDLLAPMRRLAGSGFVGRERELQQLEQYVFSAKPDAPLFVFGTGGVGKSTLLARFVLEHVVPNDVPIAYLDIDRPTIRPDHPLTLLLEAVAQFRPQVDWPADAADSLLKEITHKLGRQEPGRQLESGGAESSEILDLFARSFGQQLHGRKAVLIVDTLEAAQFLGSDVVWTLVEFLFDLEESLENLRVILSGRSLPEEYTAKAFPGLSAPVQPPSAGTDWLDQIPQPDRPINLAVLDDAAARHLLQRSLRDAGLDPLGERDLADVIGIVSSNPMCLKLAARLLRDEGVEKLREGRVEFLAKLKAEKIQGLLYGRILRHVHGDDVRKVAYPGLILRRIDPDVIREVLAGPCGLELTPERNEYAIFDELRREAALVETDPDDGSLRHRADVRRAMLEDLTDRVDKEVVEAIDHSAVEFYEDRPGAISRAEEIYHRLRRGESTATLESRWTAEAGPRLDGGIDELPAQQQLWLASRLGVTLDPSVRESADQDEWEEQAARSADRYLQAGAVHQALAVLNERGTRSPRSRLYALEAETYRFLGKFDDALQVARRGVESASRAGAIDMALELLLKMAVIEEARANPSEADVLVDEAAAVAPHCANRVLQLRVATTKLRLQRQLRPSAREERAKLRRETLGILDDGTLHTLRAQPVLLREVAAELAKQDARVAAMAIETLGLEVGSDAQAQALGKAIATLNRYQGATASDAALAAGAEQFQKSAFDPGVIRKWATEVATHRDTRRLGSALAATEAGNKVLSGFREYFRAGVGSALRGGSGTI